jgi:hypothetical protein
MVLLEEAEVERKEISLDWEVHSRIVQGMSYNFLT